MKLPPMDPWASGVRAADVPIVNGGDPNPLENADVPPGPNGGDPSGEFETADAPLRPNKTDIARHLYELFPPTFVQPYPDAWIEIAHGDPATGGPEKAQNSPHSTSRPLPNSRRRRIGPGSMFTLASH